MLAAACRVISQEMPHVTCRLVDVVRPQEERLEREIQNGREPVVALRGDRRLVESFVPVRVEAPQGAPGLRKEGVYLITGGFGRIGMVLAEHLARTVSARLVLVGRSPESPSHAAKVRRLEEAGGEVLAVQADVGDEEQMAAAVAAAVGRFGALHGVIHAAADTRSEAFAPVAELTRDLCELQFRAKVHGLQVLERVLRGIDLDFCLLTSSLASVLGGLGFAAYAGASRYLDAFARRQGRASRVPWMSVDWEGWTAERTGASRAARFALTDEEGVEVFRRLLSVLGEPQIAVSTGDLEERIAAPGERAAGSLEETKDSGERSAEAAARELPAAPRDEVERAVAGIWRELLGVERVGIWDDFFELGGHSLLATRVVARVRDTYRIDLPLLDLFREPTVAGLSQRVRERLGTAAAGPGPAPIAAARGREEELLASLPEMSDADIDGLIRDILAGQGEIR
jgi:NAD(P)-dependent dehydrogenase (short-subunit alcohol dehydrogenase family)